MVYFPMGRFLKENGSRHDTVVLDEAGFIPYYSEMRVVDMYGLTDAHILDAGFSPDYIFSRNPTFLSLASSSEDEYLPIIGAGSEPRHRAIFDHPAFSDFEVVAKFRWPDAFGSVQWLFQKRKSQGGPAGADKHSD